jgi:hypothetical protein
VTAPLLLLLGAATPDLIAIILSDVFRGRHEGVSQLKRVRIAQQLSIDAAATNEVR